MPSIQRRSSGTSAARATVSLEGFSRERDIMAIRDSMRASAAQYLRPGERLEAVIGAQTSSQYLLVATGVLFFFINRYRILVVTPERILVLDAGRWSMTKAQGVVTELPRSTRLGPGKGVWHRLPVDTENLRVHRRFFKDIETADFTLQLS
jgi:hypothetical protein